MPERRKLMTGRITLDNRIGQWRFDAESGRLVAGEEERKLEDRAARTLALLCERRGEIVSREDSLAAVWGGRAVSENSVAVVMRDLRRALDDDAKEPRFIETVAKRGYRLAPAAARRKMIWPVTAGVAMVFAIVAGFAFGQRHPVVIAVESVRNETGQEQYAPLSSALTQVVVDQAAKLDGVAVVSAEAPARLRLEGRLILWNGIPALGLTATDPANGHVVWTGMVEGREDVIAKLTAAKLDDLGRRIRHGAGSEE
jgi:DNA-binding winged helix-turn-helix (wHTH) protein